MLSLWQSWDRRSRAARGRSTVEALPYSIAVRVGDVSRWRVELKMIEMGVLEVVKKAQQ